jgi:hypothetical protein
MINATARRPVGGRSTRDPVRFTALLYLKEALLKERYEECRDIIAVAYEFGATENEVEGLLEDPRRNP